MLKDLHRDITLLLARVGLGIIFIAHGWQKFHEYKIAGVTASFRAMDVPLPEASAYYATYVELFGGILLIAGVLTQLVGVLLLGDMLGAYATVHEGHGILSSSDGAELVLALGIISLVLAVYGPGRASIDALLVRVLPVHKLPLNRFIQPARA